MPCGASASKCFAWQSCGLFFTQSAVCSQICDKLGAIIVLYIFSPYTMPKQMSFYIARKPEVNDESPRLKNKL